MRLLSPPSTTCACSQPEKARRNDHDEDLTSRHLDDCRWAVGRLSFTGCPDPTAACSPWSYADLAAAYARTGQEDEARAAVAELSKLMPDYTVERWLKDGKGWSDNPVFLAEFQRIAEGLRRAGLPES